MHTQLTHLQHLAAQYHAYVEDSVSGGINMFL